MAMACVAQHRLRLMNSQVSRSEYLPQSTIPAKSPMRSLSRSRSIMRVARSRLDARAVPCGLPNRRGHLKPCSGRVPYARGLLEKLADRVVGLAGTLDLRHVTAVELEVKGMRQRVGDVPRE